MKADVCARELDSGQTTRLTDTMSSFGFLNQSWKDQVIFDETTDVFRTVHFTISVRSASTQPHAIIVLARLFIFYFSYMPQSASS